MSPSPGDLVVRRIPFTFPDDLDPVWQPNHHEWSHMVNGASLTMPYLEPFLIATVREAIPMIDDDRIVESARGFIGQEAQHFKAHRRYNELLKSKGYPELAQVEADLAAAYDRIKATKSLTWRLAYTAGFETMTLGMTHWLVGDRRRLFGGADSRVASFVLWHFVEEGEHKRVAFDVYQAAAGGYRQRVLGLVTGALHVFWWSRKACHVMLRADGLRWNVRSRLRLWRRTAAFFAAVVPGAIRSLRPSHSPDDEADPEWMRDWIAGYDRLDGDPRRDGAVPLIDTDHPDLPVPF